MIFTVVASGESAKDWMSRGTAIGSNDCEKFTKPVDYLILANHPGKFKERLNIIKKSKAKVFTTSKKQWGKIFPNCEQITRITSFNQRILNGFIYTSSTTPIMCISMAIKMGATEIILWGIDMKNHRVWSQGTKQGNREIAIYLKFFAACEKIGVKLWRGADGTAFDLNLPLYE